MKSRFTALILALTLLLAVSVPLSGCAARGPIDQAPAALASADVTASQVAAKGLAIVDASSVLLEKSVASYVRFDAEVNVPDALDQQIRARFRQVNDDMRQAAIKLADANLSWAAVKVILDNLLSGVNGVVTLSEQISTQARGKDWLTTLQNVGAMVADALIRLAPKPA